VPRLSIFKRGNFFFRMSNFPLFTPKNSIGLTVSRLIIVSVNRLFLDVYKKEFSISNIKNENLVLLIYLFTSDKKC